MFDLTIDNNKVWIEACLKNEMFVAKNLKHPAIIFTFDVIKTRRNAYIIMQFAAGGDVSKRMYEDLKRPYTEEESKTYFKDLMSGLVHMHHQNVAHRDLKLENFLLNDRNQPLISDFSFAALGCKQTQTMLTTLMRATLCGTPGYLAPELSMKRAAGALYDAKAVDIFAIGVCLFEMLNKAKPYPEVGEVTDAILRQDIRYQAAISADCRELIGAMLRFESGSRPNADQVAKHKWIEPGIFGTFINTIFG